MGSHARPRETFETTNPATGQVIAKIASCGKADVDLAVEKARSAFEAGVWFKKGRSEGAKVVTGGNAHKSGKGYFIEPTIFDNVTPSMTIAREEIFGPVLSVITVANADEAVRVANDTPYGLAASVFSANLGKAHRIARDIRAGTVTINCYGEGDVSISVPVAAMT
ncbi:aldehyde dehydrogenase family protein [Mesorhizobium sp. M1334]|uniref:aldehyde dehydrogenase family protein n=1 Tax=Mesorhizobium sp. M1334 TaxID=2957084 RepID=UPI00333AA426